MLSVERRQADTNLVYDEGVAPVAKALTGTAFGLKGAHDIYTAGTENTPQAWQQRLQGAAQIAGGAAVTAEPVADAASAVSDKLEAPASTVKNIVKGGHPNNLRSGRTLRSGRPGGQPPCLDFHWRRN